MVSSPTATRPLVDHFRDGLAAPICLTWELTWACNLACVHCMIEGTMDRLTQQPDSEFQAVLDEQRRNRREVVAAKGHGVRADEACADSLPTVLDQLDEEERALLRLRHVEGMRIRAIAQMIGKTPQAIESAIRRAIGRLREGGAS